MEIVLAGYGEHIMPDSYREAYRLLGRSGKEAGFVYSRWLLSVVLYIELKSVGSATEQIVTEESPA